MNVFISLRQPYALTVFQVLVNDVLRSFLNQFVFVYLDDILVFYPDLVMHQQHFRQVLQALLNNHLYVKAEKCNLHASSVSFLGYVVGEGTITMDQEKVWVVQEWLTLESRKQP